MGRFWAGLGAVFSTLLAVACGATHSGGGSGGGSNDAGGAGSSLPPGTFVQEIRQTMVDKVDLLLVVDNSISMADKQELLADAMPVLVQRLVTPNCLRPCQPADNCTATQQIEGIATGSNADSSGRCIMGSPDLPPIRDLHVGVITSSLGSHGAMGPKDVCARAVDNDRAHLVGELRGLTGTWKDIGFLAWDPAGHALPQGDVDAQVFVTKFTDMIKAAGEHGCGYESTLEAWYRFLIDPEPPLNIMLEGASSHAVGIDPVVIEQRAQFLRSDSLVAIVMLTDENDCSIRDSGYGWTVATSAPMSRSSSQCLANPNDPCCQACGDPSLHAGCPPLAGDAECAKGPMVAAVDDDLNLRCWQQKRRFGMDLLYPTSRYSDALRSPTVVATSTGQMVPNPLFAAGPGLVPRDRGLVFLEGIVGVPWQDLADQESLTGPGLRYLTATQLEQNDRWSVILGQPDANPAQPPSDPFMVETPMDRTTLGIGLVNPITMASLVPAESTNPIANPINGHEQVNLGNRDLQYACTFPLAKSRDCPPGGERGCDCELASAPSNRPLCQPPGGGAAASTQYFAKAYPGLRFLQVLKDVGDNAIVASTCPKVVADRTSAAYGYNPAIDALVGRIRGSFKGRCFPRSLAVDETGRVPCTVVEARRDLPASCDCAALGRVSLASRPQIATNVRQTLASGFECGAEGNVACDALCLCELPQLAGADLTNCQTAAQAAPVPGFCYLNAMPNEKNVGNAELVQSCAADSKRLIRFVGGAPSMGATTLIQCDAAAVGMP